MTRDQAIGAALRVYVVLIYALIFTPILVSFVFSFSAARFPTIPMAELSTQWYAQMLADEGVRAGFRNSLVVGATVAVIATVIGFGAAYTDYRFRFLGKRLYVAMGLMPPMVPVLILGIAMLFFLSQLRLSAALHSVVIAHVVYCTPFAMAVNRLRLAQLDENLEAAAWNLGASPWRALRHVVLPFCLPSLLASLFVTAAISFDEFAIAWFVSGLEETLPVQILNMVHRESSPMINAIGSVTFSISMTLVILAQVLMLTRRRSIGGRVG